MSLLLRDRKLQEMRAGNSPFSTHHEIHQLPRHDNHLFYLLTLNVTLSNFRFTSILFQF